VAVPKSSQTNNLDRGTVLVVEDERDLAELLALHLRRAGYQTFISHDGLGGLELARRHHPDLLVLDVMIPGLSGTEVASRVRADPSLAGVLIVMLTAKSEEVDQLVGLAVGADDYITKPFSVKVLIAKIQALLRRASGAAGAGAPSPPLRLGGIEVNTASHEARAGGEPLKLTLTEFRILAALLRAGGRVLSRHELVSKAIGPGITVTDRTIDVHMTALRKKLGHHGALIHTVRGVGYRASEEPERASP
jgi:DNA-binding response OmpR family regulator